MSGINKTQRLIKSLKQETQPSRDFGENRTPIATDMYLPNLSGILGNQDAKNKLDTRYLGSNSQTQPVRALNTVYQNTSGAQIIVYGSCAITWADDNFPGDTAYFTCLTGAANPPTTARQKGGADIVYNSIALPNMAARHEFAFWFAVDNNHYYEITSTVSGSAGIVALGYWNEIARTIIPI